MNNSAALVCSTGSSLALLARTRMPPGALVKALSIKVLSLIVFFSSFIAILYYLGIMSVVIRVIGGGLQRAWGQAANLPKSGQRLGFNLDPAA